MPYEVDKYCPKCGMTYRKVGGERICCLVCGHKLSILTDNIPKCPTCQSIRVEKISSLSKAAHGVAFGILSKTARSQFVCHNCGYKW